MKNPDSHIYLYAKGWYAREDVLEDLKKILSHRSGIPSEDITFVNILTVLTPLVFKELKLKSYGFYEFLRRISLFSSDIEKSLLKELLSILTTVKVKGENNKTIIPLDDPDPNILPLHIGDY